MSTKGRITSASFVSAQKGFVTSASKGATASAGFLNTMIAYCLQQSDYAKYEAAVTDTATAYAAGRNAYSNVFGDGKAIEPESARKQITRKVQAAAPEGWRKPKSTSDAAVKQAAARGVKESNKPALRTGVKPAEKRAVTVAEFNRNNIKAHVLGLLKQAEFDGRNFVAEKDRAQYENSFATLKLICDSLLPKPEVKGKAPTDLPDAPM